MITLTINSECQILVAQHQGHYQAALAFEYAIFTLYRGPITVFLPRWYLAIGAQKLQGKNSILCSR